MDRSPLPTFLPAELERLEDALLRLCPSRQFQIRQVTFPTTVGQSLDITHTLRPERAEFIDWVVIQSMYPCLVYQPTGETFGEGYVRLACTQPGAPVTLLLMVTAEVPNRAPLVGSSLDESLSAYRSQAFHIGGVSLQEFSGGNLALDGIDGAAVRWSRLGAIWEIAQDANGGDLNNNALVFYDATNGRTIVQLRQVSGAYHLQPAPNQNSVTDIYLGQNSTDGRWDNVYAKNLNSTAGLTERGRSVAAGEWASVSYAAGNFTASAGTWTVDAGDVVTHRYMLIGKTMWISFAFQNTDVSNAAVTLRLTLPGGATSAATTYSAIRAIDAGGVEVASIALCPVGQTYVEFYATSAAGTFGATAADNTTVSGMVVVEIV
jgi:hypothetical protein